MTIPKIIHYCWFGPMEIPKTELKCIESWHRFFPDYKFMFWNEETFDIEKHPFTKQAHKLKYYAFVSDFVRTQVLLEYGGIYLDTDVEILGDIIQLTEKFNGILGFENQTMVGTALMAFTPNHQIMAGFTEHYLSNDFIKSNGQIEMTANPSILAKVLVKYGFHLNGKEQNIDGVQIYDREVFFPKKISASEFRVTKKTVSIHHFSASWLTDRQKRRGTNKFWIEVCRPSLKWVQKNLRMMLGESTTKQIEIRIRNLIK